MCVVHPSYFQLKLLFYKACHVVTDYARLTCLAVLRLRFQLAYLCMTFVQPIGYFLKAASLFDDLEQVLVSDLGASFHVRDLRAFG